MMYEQQQEQQQSFTLNYANRFQLLRQIEQWASFGLVGFLLFVGYVFGLIIGEPLTTPHYGDWINFAWFPWFAIWTIITIVLAGLALIFLARYQQKRTLQSMLSAIRTANPITDPSMPTTRPPVSPRPMSETTVTVVEGELA